MAAYGPTADPAAGTIRLNANSSAEDLRRENAYHLFGDSGCVGRAAAVPGAIYAPGMEVHV